MSTNNNARKLLDRMASDDAFRTQVTNAPDVDAKKAIISAAGFGDVTPVDVAAAGANYGHELSDAELEAVAGGRTVEWALVGATVVLAAATAA
ncbi:MAG TPA: Nif11-like leader peptide family RiPP precursor [Longimicrobium sp.]|nr:Nif11-like leader peptide family RiPP precursor [Longimicrobium sp.]